MLESDKPIGIFDSGIGGLTVYKALKEYLPSESFIYLGDTARLPYGTKSERAVVRFSIDNTEFLLKFGIKALVVACNTSSSIAIKELREKFPGLPIIGVIEPSAKLAMEMSSSGRIGVIGTEATIRSGRYRELLERDGAEVFSQPCPLFVPLVEEGWIEHRVTQLVAEEYLAWMRGKIDTLILGCTHYPVIKRVIGEAVGKEVRLIESGFAVARELKRMLKEKSLLRGDGEGEDMFFVTDFLSKFSRVAEIFLGRKIKIEERKFSMC